MCAQENFSKRLVKVGDRIRRGQQIGVQGATGNTTGPHCHTKILVDRKYIDPTPYIVGDPDRLKRLKAVYADPVTAGEDIAEQFRPRYLEKDPIGLKVRSGPSTEVRQLGALTMGTIFSALEMTGAEGFTQARHTGGWSALAKTAKAQAALMYGRRHITITSDYG